MLRFTFRSRSGRSRRLPLAHYRSRVISPAAVADEFHLISTLRLGRRRTPLHVRAVSLLRQQNGESQRYFAKRCLQASLIGCMVVIAFADGGDLLHPRDIGTIAERDRVNCDPGSRGVAS